MYFVNDEYFTDFLRVFGRVCCDISWFFKINIAIQFGHNKAETETSESVTMSGVDRFTLPTQGDAVLELWRSKMAEGVLSYTHFQDYWRVIVPRIYSPQPNRTCLGKLLSLILNILTVILIILSLIIIFNVMLLNRTGLGKFLLLAVFIQFWYT